MNHYDDLGHAAHRMIENLRVYGEMVDPGRWQGVPTEGKPDLITKEMLNVSFDANIPPSADELAHTLMFGKHHLNLPWAEAHFQERVSRRPTNPGFEYMNWPWWQGQYATTASAVSAPTTIVGHGGSFTFDHTYQERFWPKEAGKIWGGDLGRITGIRYEYGDLDDVIDLLYREPYTRQATFPIFFPEDTGVVHGGRIPCTLHYHFLLRHRQLNLWYPIRSCDAVRHFYDDLYMACRLCHWALEQLVDKELRDDTPQMWVDVDPGLLYFTAYSFHVHMGDYHLL